MTFIGGLRHDGMTVPWLLDGPIDGPAFITCIKTRLDLYQNPVGTDPQ